VKNYIFKRDASFLFEHLVLIVAPSEILHRQFMSHCVLFGNSSSHCMESGDSK
jgi:hypothetical protein